MKIRAVVLFDAESAYETVKSVALWEWRNSYSFRLEPILYTNWCSAYSLEIHGTRDICFNRCLIEPDFVALRKILDHLIDGGNGLLAQLS